MPRCDSLRPPASRRQSPRTRSNHQRSQLACRSATSAARLFGCAVRSADVCTSRPPTRPLRCSSTPATSQHLSAPATSRAEPASKLRHPGEKPALPSWAPVLPHLSNLEGQRSGVRMIAWAPTGRPERDRVGDGPRAVHGPDRRRGGRARSARSIGRTRPGSGDLQMRAFTTRCFRSPARTETDKQAWDLSAGGKIEFGYVGYRQRTAGTNRRGHQSELRRNRRVSWQPLREGAVLDEVDDSSLAEARQPSTSRTLLGRSYRRSAKNCTGASGAEAVQPMRNSSDGLWCTPLRGG